MFPTPSTRLLRLSVVVLCPRLRVSLDISSFQMLQSNAKNMFFRMVSSRYYSCVGCWLPHSSVTQRIGRVTYQGYSVWSKHKRKLPSRDTMYLLAVIARNSMSMYLTKPQSSWPNGYKTQSLTFTWNDILDFKYLDIWANCIRNKGKSLWYYDQQGLTTYRF